MTELSPKDRVFDAAAAVDREGGKPTVATVRERAGVNNADATRYLREWREDRAAAGTKIAALPSALVEQAQRVASAMWVEASSLAAASHAALEREWQEQRALQEQEITELVENLDAANEASASLEANLAQARADADAAASDLQTAQQSLAELQTQLVQERTANDVLRETLASLIARIPAEGEQSADPKAE